MGGQSESDQDFKVAGLVLRVLHKKLCALLIDVHALHGLIFALHEVP